MLASSESLWGSARGREWWRSRYWSDGFSQSFMEFLNLLAATYLFPSFSRKSKPEIGSLALVWTEDKAAAVRVWVLRVIELEETLKHTHVQTETLSILFFSCFVFTCNWKNKGFSKVMNACVHYFSESVCKYKLLSNFCQNTLSLNTIFQIYESTSIKWNYLVSLSSVTLPPDPKGSILTRVPGGLWNPDIWGFPTRSPLF